MKIVLAWILALSLGACATPAPPLEPLQLFNDAAFTPIAQPPTVDEIFAVSPAIRNFLSSPDVMRELRSKGAQRGLFEVLRDKSGLRIEYDSAMTRTAAQAFDAKAGNCLSLVIMTAAMANELNMPVYFQEVHVDQAWTRFAGLYFVAGHVNISLARRPIEHDIRFDGSNEFVIDFLPPADIRNQRTRRITQATIAAMFMNNRAAEALAEGQTDKAYWWAREALTQAPDFIPAYNTLGVVYLRKGDLQRAQTAFETTLKSEPMQLIALSNLARVMELKGDVARAAQLRSSTGPVST